MQSKFNEDAELKIYIDNLLTTQWNLALEYCQRFPDQKKMGMLRGKINTYKNKIWKRVDGLKKGILL